MVTSRGLPFATSPTTSLAVISKKKKNQKNGKAKNKINVKFATFLATFETIFEKNNVETMSRLHLSMM